MEYLAATRSAAYHDPHLKYQLQPEVCQLFWNRYCHILICVCPRRFCIRLSNRMSATFVGITIEMDLTRVIMVLPECVNVIFNNFCYEIRQSLFYVSKSSFQISTASEPKSTCFFKRIGFDTISHYRTCYYVFKDWHIVGDEGTPRLAAFRWQFIARVPTDLSR